jgi:hypothetical protein
LFISDKSTSVNENSPGFLIRKFSWSILYNIFQKLLTNRCVYTS